MPTPAAKHKAQKAAAEFAAKWRGIGDEKQHTHNFWAELLQNIFGIEKPFEFMTFEDKVALDDTTVESEKKNRGYIDITTGGSCCFGSPAEGIMTALERGVDPKLITMSSDGHGSKPRFNDKGEMIGLAVCGIECNLTCVQELVGRHGLDLPTALGFITSNVADSHLIADQGRITEGACGNALLFNEDLTLTDVFAKGRAMMRNGEILAKGTFEI